MMKTARIPRRVFLAGAGAAFAQLTLLAPVSRAQMSPQGAPGRLGGPAAGAQSHRRRGLGPGYIVPSRSNPYFVPMGKARHEALPTPKAYHGKSLMED